MMGEGDTSRISGVRAAQHIGEHAFRLIDENPRATNGARSKMPGGPVVIVVEPKTLVADCIGRVVNQALGSEVLTVPTVEAGLAAGENRDVQLAVLAIEANPLGETAFEQIRQLVGGLAGSPTIILGSSGELGEIIEVLRCGARGYISMEMSLKVAIEAIRLVLAGGQYLPAGSVLENRPVSEAHNSTLRREVCGQLLTTRQVAVVDALRKGKPNKIIAHELGMRESTVKVHVRNIMKRLNVKNRTELAYIANEASG